MASALAAAFARARRPAQHTFLLRALGAAVVATLLVCASPAPTRAACLAVGQVATLRFQQRTVDGALDPAPGPYSDFRVTLTVTLPDRLSLRAERGGASNAYTAWYRQDAPRDR